MLKRCTGTAEKIGKRGARFSGGKRRIENVALGESDLKGRDRRK